MSCIDMGDAYQEYSKLVYRFLYSHTRDAEWSEELTQETFLRAVDSISRYDGSCKLSVWLCQIAKHVLWQELRRKKRFQTVEWTETLSNTSSFGENPADGTPEGETAVIRKENKLELYRAVHHLPELEREVVLYRITGELSFREIGALLGRSENWSRVVFYRAKQKIREELNLHER